MKNNILIAFITIFTSSAGFSTNHNGINPERLHTVDFLVETLNNNPKWQDFCDEQQDNAQCKFIQNATRRVNSLLKTKRLSDATSNEIKHFLLLRNALFIANQLNDDSYYAAVERNWHELSLQMKEANKDK